MTDGQAQPPLPTGRDNAGTPRGACPAARLLLLTCAPQAYIPRTAGAPVKGARFGSLTPLR